MAGVGEDALDAVLGVVKVPTDGADSHVGPLLGDHLQLLDLADAVLRVKHQDLGLGHVGEALHGGLAGVSGGGHQDAGGLVLPCLFQAGGEELGSICRAMSLKALVGPCHSSRHQVFPPTRRRGATAGSSNFSGP